MLPSKNFSMVHSPSSSRVEYAVTWMATKSFDRGELVGVLQDRGHDLGHDAGVDHKG